MTAHVHLEGLGVVGSLLAWTLDARDIAFTWSDTEDDITGWRACTGTIYPDGTDPGATAYAGWHDWRADPPWPDTLDQYVETCRYWYSHQHPPHGGSYDHAERVDGGLARAPDDHPSYHLNAQQFIPATRDAFADSRLDTSTDPGPDTTTVITHGFSDNPRNDRYTWGWTVPVTATTGHLTRDGHRACVYTKDGGHAMAYLFPKPDTDHYYAGTTIVPQDTPRPLDIIPKFETWLDRLARTTENTITAEPIPDATPVQGWRPIAADDDTALVTRLDADTLACRPMGGSGIRYAPATARSLLNHEILRT